MSEITQVLERIQKGEPAAEALLPLVCEESAHAPGMLAPERVATRLAEPHQLHRTAHRPSEWPEDLEAYRELGMQFDRIDDAFLAGDPVALAQAVQDTLELINRLARTWTG